MQFVQRTLHTPSTNASCPLHHLTKPFRQFTPAASKAILKFWHERRLSFRKEAPVTDNQKDFSGGNTTKQHGVAKKNLQVHKVETKHFTVKS